MYGILAACIAVMAMFLALFALSVEPEPGDLTQNLQKSAAVQTIEVNASRPATQ